MSSPCVGIYVGICGDAGKHARETKNLPAKHLNAVFWTGLYGVFWGLYQTEFGCPFDSRPAIIHVEFTVNTLGIIVPVIVPVVY